MAGRSARALTAVLALAIAAMCGSCDVETLLNQTASFGGDTAGSRGTTDLVFINKTPFRAIFTFGTYDDFDQNTEPELVTFSPNDGSQDLEGGDVSTIRTVTCARVFSIGGATMLRLAEENLDPDTLVDEAMVPGVYFSGAELGDENEALPTEGVADPLDLRLGVDFPCNSLIVYRLEVNSNGERPFRVDFEVIPSRDDR
jgi:hypothetical protein